MKVDLNETIKERRDQMLATARRTYGEQRARELADQIEHLASAMTGVAQAELEPRDLPLPGPIDETRGAQ
jgi:hypothetical protein